MPWLPPMRTTSQTSRENDMAKTKFVEKMTPEQESKVPVYLDKWLKNGRKTARIDRKKAVEAVKTIYRVAGMEEPTHFHFYPSPIQCQLAVNIMKSEDFKKIVGTAVEGSNLWSNLVSNLRSNLRSNLSSNLRPNIGAKRRSDLCCDDSANHPSAVCSTIASSVRSD